MNRLDYKENVTISLTVFIVESVGSIEGTEEDDEPAGDRGADWKTSTGTEKNYLFFVCLFVYLFLVQMLENLVFMAASVSVRVSKPSFLLVLSLFVSIVFTVRIQG